MSGWQPIETAPKDGRAVLLASARRPAKCHIGCWDRNGTSWVDEHGQPSDEAYELAVTGVWLSGGGWFQPNEVTHWMPLPEPPACEEEAG